MPQNFIRYYQCAPYGEWPKDAGGQMRWTWEGTMSVDLRWVAAAKPFTDAAAGLSATIIMLCGSNQWDTINIPYEAFMADWSQAKGT